MLVHFLILYKIALILNALVNYCHSAYTNLWHAWVVIHKQHNFIMVMALFKSLCLYVEILYILMGIQLPLLPVSILYFVCIYSLATFLNHCHFCTSDDVEIENLWFTMSIPVLAYHCSHNLGACYELFSVFCHLLAPVCFGLCILTWSG